MKLAEKTDEEYECESCCKTKKGVMFYLGFGQIYGNFICMSCLLTFVNNPSQTMIKSYAENSK